MEILRKYRALVLLFIMLVFLAFAFNSLAKPFILDDLIFVTAAQNWIGEGRPVYYNGELITGNLMLVHPPMYLYLLTLSSRIFGLGEFTIRLVGILFSMGTILLVYLLASELAKNSREKHLIALLSSFIYAISPFVIQSSLVVDIDGTILTFLMTLTLLLLVKGVENLSLKDSILFGLLLGIVMWAKLQGAFFILSALLIFYILSGNFRKIKHTLLIGIVAVSLFLLSWGLYCAAFNFSFWVPFKHNLGFLDNFNQVSLMQQTILVIWSFKNLLFWMTPSFLVIVIAVLFQGISRYKKLHRLEPSDLLLVYSLVIVAFFSFMQQTGYGYPKYFILIMPALSILVAGFLASFNFGSMGKPVSYSILLVIFLMLFNFFILKDPFIDHNIFFNRTLSLEDNFGIYLVYNLKGLLFLVPSIIALFYFFALKYGMYRSLVLSSAVVLISTSVYVDFIQARAGYSTNYAYGQRGVLEAADYIKENSVPDDIIISPQSIAYYSERKFYISYPAMPEFLDRFDNITATRRIPFIVLSPSERLPDFSERYAFDRQIGSFKIFRAIAPGQNVFDQSRGQAEI